MWRIAGSCPMLTERTENTNVLNELERDVAICGVLDPGRRWYIEISNHFLLSGELRFKGGRTLCIACGSIGTDT